MGIMFSRTARTDWEKCPRKRYYSHEIFGRGISPVGSSRSDWPLMTGIGVHEGIGQLAQGVNVEAAVQQALLASGYVSLPDVVDAKEAQAQLEQLALIEALVRCWAVAYLPQFQQEYEMIAVECEEQVELAPGVIMMVRPDLVVRRRSDNAIFTWQLKTAKRADEKWAAQWPLDQMTISEVLAVEARLNSDAALVERAIGSPLADNTVAASLDGEFLRTSPSPICVSGVIVQGLVKGDQSEWPKGSGNWSFNSPLIYAWRNVSGKPTPQGEWTARHKWSDEYGNHTLGKGWRKVAVWSDYPGGIAAWIGWLQQNDPAILEQQIVTLQPILRAPYEMERWRTSVVASEQQIRKDRDLMKNVHHCQEPEKTAARYLNRHFPMHTSGGNCVWPYRCSYFDICHGMAQPDDSELFKPRELNHKQEVIE